MMMLKRKIQETIFFSAIFPALLPTTSFTPTRFQPSPSLPVFSFSVFTTPPLLRRTSAAVTTATASSQPRRRLPCSRIPNNASRLPPLTRANKKMVGNAALFTAGSGALALLGGAGAAYVEYSTYQDNDCVNVISTSVYAGVPSECGKQDGGVKWVCESMDG